ncbi:hypothetical protein RRG08_066246 [Elysia crispata]|uniref:Uncharacterized protein n=1 Tax=Elysia crispata TaxID=231223 RepID=A0AAE1BDP9_9GAST|nr:hypothetical protein RRG08_066246 [Elysia crispata]
MTSCPSPQQAHKLALPPASVPSFGLLEYNYAICGVVLVWFGLVFKGACATLTHIPEKLQNGVCVGI